MTTSTSPATTAETPEFRVALKWSAIGHGVLFLVVLIKNLIFPGHSTPYIPTLKVDLVGLPDILKKDMANPNLAHFNHEISDILKQTREDTKEMKADNSIREAVQKNEMTVHPKTNSSEKRIDQRNLQALQRIKALAKISGEDNSASKAPPLIKGNKISPGADLSGDAKEASEANYYDTLRAKLQENWTLPTWVARQNLSAQAQIFIDPKGKLRKFKLMKSSNNPQFDDAVKKAVLDSQPFPPPPKELQEVVLADGILVGFPL